MDMPVFTYGTLQFQTIIDGVLNPGSRTAVEALLPSWVLGTLRGRDYPGLVEGSGEGVRGILWEGLDASDLDRLDAWEGAEYRRTTLEVRTAMGTRKAWAWVARDPGAVDRESPWDPRDWAQGGLGRSSVPPRLPQAWLMKSEPSEASIDDLAAAPDRTLGWFGVRNYQARNFMRDQMRPGDLVFFYHSSCPRPGVAGLARVAREAYPDPTQFDPHSKYFDPKARAEAPRWHQVDVRLVRKTALLGLDTLRATPGLEGMRLLQRGNRLSITPVDPGEALVLESLLLDATGED